MWPADDVTQLEIPSVLMVSRDTKKTHNTERHRIRATDGYSWERAKHADCKHEGRSALLTGRSAALSGPWTSSRRLFLSFLFDRGRVVIGENDAGC
jgi:hypothetical protein